MKIKNFKLKINKRKVIVVITVISIIVPLVVAPLVLNRPDKPVEVEKTQASSGSGNVITTIKDTDNTNLVENAHAAGKDPAFAQGSGEAKETYRWTVELGRGTTYYFGLQEPGGVRPVVKMRNKEGWWVRYEPHIANASECKANDNECANSLISSNSLERTKSERIGLNSRYVSPKVDGNSIEWTLPNGVIAKYTSLKDRIKADYIVKDKSSLCHSGLSRISLQRDESERDPGVVADAPPQNDDCKNTKLDFIVEYNDSYAGDNGEGVINGAGYLKHELMPTGDIAWLGENGGTVFNMPAPVVQEVKSQKSKVKSTTENSKVSGVIASDSEAISVTGEEGIASSPTAPRNDKNDPSFEIQKTGTGTSLLSINIPEGLDYPIIVDPVVVDSAAAVTATAYGNGRKILRDAFGNLILLCACGTGTEDDDVWYKNKSDENANASVWTDANLLNGLDSGTANSAVDIAADIDSSGNIHTQFRTTAAGLLAIRYRKLSVTRDSSNNITSISGGLTFTIDSSEKGTRPSVIVANKGEGAGKEKIAVAWAMNSTTGGTKRGEIRFLQCDVADDCAAAANWKNASEEKTGDGTCSDTDTAGSKGLPNAIGCKGAADKMFINGTGHFIDHAVLTQVPGRPARTPTDAKGFDSPSTYTNLTNALDDNTGTSATIDTFDQTGDLIYIGDDNKFSKMVFDVGTANSSSGNLCGSSCQYWNGSTWANISNIIDNTANTGSFKEDGSYLFDEPSDWAKTTVDGANKYWVRFGPTVNGLVSVTITEIEVTDRHSKDLLIVGGVDIDTGGATLLSTYVIWDFVGQAGWENNPSSTAAPWRSNEPVDDDGANWSEATNFPLTITTDLINNAVYVAFYACAGAGCGTTSVLKVKRIPNNLSLTVTANWSDTVFPAVTEAADIVLSLTSDQSDIYLVYVLDPDTNSLVWRKCTPSGGGDGNICDVAADWGSEISLSNNVDTTEEPVHPQAIVSKAFGDTVAMDVVYTNNLATDTVKYERRLVDMADMTKAVTVSGDDAVEDKCISVSTDSQTISGTTVKLGGEATFGACSSGGVNHHVGFHFPSISVGQGANISSAYIDFRVSSRTGGGTAAAFTVYGEDADNSSAFAAVADPCGVTCINGRTKTTSSSSQSIDFSTNSYRIDVTNMVQEIVCRGAANAQPCVGNFNGAGTWASGNALSMLLISTVGASNNNASIDAFDATATVMLDPTLQINCAGSGCGTGNPRINYSMGVLKPPSGSGTTGDLGHPMSAIQFGQVTTDDSLYASVSASLVSSASSSATPMYMFKVNNSNNNNADRIRATAIIKTNQAGAHARSPTHLQVYRGGSYNGWITLASTAVNMPTDTDITMDSGPILTSLSDYYQAESGPNLACSSSSSNCWVYFRIYQEPPTDNFNEVLYVDYFNTTFGVFADTNIQTQIRGGTRIQGGSRIQ